MSNYRHEDAAMPYTPEPSAETLSEMQRVKETHEQELMAIDGVEGVGIGTNKIGDEAIIVYLRSRDVADRVPRTIEGFPVETQITGIIDAY